MSSDIDETIGRRIYQRRRLMGLTQREVGEHVGVRFQQIQKYECGANRVAAATLFRISQALQVPMAYFFSDDLTPSADRIDAIDSEGHDTYDLLRAFRQIRGTPRRRLVSLARALARGDDVAPRRPHALQARPSSIVRPDAPARSAHSDA